MLWLIEIFPTFPQGRKKGVDPKNASKKKNQLQYTWHHETEALKQNRQWGSKKLNWEIRDTSVISMFRPINCNVFLKQ